MRCEHQSTFIIMLDTRARARSLCSILFVANEPPENTIDDERLCGVEPLRSRSKVFGERETRALRQRPTQNESCPDNAIRELDEHLRRWEKDIF